MLQQNVEEEYTSLYSIIGLLIPVRRRRKFSFETITTSVQIGISSLHSITSLPWWCTFAASTIFVRISLFPLVRFHLLSLRKIAGAMPDLNVLTALFSDKLKSIVKSPIVDKLNVFKTYFDGVRASLIVNEVSIFRTLMYPLINLSLFITFVRSLKDMVNSDKYDMDTGGFSWFKDLSAKDSTFVLPITALSITYCSLELAFRSSNPGKLVLMFKDFAQSFLILSLPFVAQLPAGVFCYWIPSSLFAMGQTALLRNVSVLKFLKIPPPISKPPGVPS
eukprot:gene6278-8645_t